MKKLIIVGLTLSAGNLFAQDLRLGDLNFFQKDKSFRVTSELAFANGETEFKFKSTSPTERKDEFDRIVWQNQVLYGIEDRFNAGLSISYALKNQIENLNNVVSGSVQSLRRDYDETGVSDPTFLANYRLSNKEIYLDGFGELTVSIGDREQGGADFNRSENGNFKQGHHSLLAGMAAGQKIMKDFEWRASLAFDYHAAGKFSYRETNTLNNKTADTDGGLDWILNGQGQYRFLKDFAVAGELELRRVGERELNYTSQLGVSTDETQDAHNIIGLGITGKWNISNSVLVSAGLRRNFAYEKDGQIENAGVVNNTTYEYTAVNEFRVGADLLF